MRGICFIALVFVGAAPAWAAANPPAPSSPGASGAIQRPIDLSALDARQMAPPAEYREKPFRSDAEDHRWTQPISIPGLSFGMAGTGTGRFAKRYAILKLQGVTLFGGNVGGSIDGRSAHLVLTWPTGP